MATIEELLQGAGQEDFSPLFSQFAEALEAFGLPADALRPVQTEEFREQAEEEAGTFFDKNLDLALKQIQQVEDQAKATKEQSERFQAEQEEQFFRTEDIGFAKSLNIAQGRATGQGLGQSGIRQGQVEDLFAGRGESLEQARRGFSQAIESRDLRFTQLQERGDITEEAERLRIGRTKETEILGRQEQLASQRTIQRRGALSQLTGSFSEFLQGIA